MRPTCILITGGGRVVVRRMDIYCYLGFPLHLYGSSWWWAESLLEIPEG